MDFIVMAAMPYCFFTPFALWLQSSEFGQIRILGVFISYFNSSLHV